MLTRSQTRYIHKTNSIGIYESAVNINVVMETVNHFRCIDLIIDKANFQLCESFIKKLHYILKTGTKRSHNERYTVGDYKKFPNIAGNMETTKPQDVTKEMQKLLKSYNTTKTKNLAEILDFHYNFESIHPFRDGNGRIGRLIMFKECLKNNIIPFIIDDKIELFYHEI